MPGVPVPILAVVASAIVFAPLSSWLALQRGRSWAAWFFFGMVLGPIAVALLVAAPPGRCPACGTRMRGWPLACPGCGLEFAADAAAVAPEASGSAGPASPDPSAPAASAPTRPAVPGRTARSARPADPLPAHDPEPSGRAATSFGRRPSDEGQAISPSTPQPSGSTVAILGSGIFMGGTAHLQIGSRYALARVGTELQALGPMHMSPSAVAARVPLAGTEATVVADRVLITGSGDRGPTLAFASVVAEPGVDFAERLKVRGRGKAVAS